MPEDQAWRYVHWPRAWPVVAGAAAVVSMFGLTEVAATSVLLEPDVPNFAYWLLDRMHFMEEQAVLLACLMLVALYVAPVAVAAVVLGARAWREGALAALLVAAAGAMLAAGGCGGGGPATGPEEPTVLAIFGSSGRGPGEFLYPRAIDLAPGGNLWVVDRTGRIQLLTTEGENLRTLTLPEFEIGYPTGISVAPSGDLYVADTHYHRVLVYDREGRLLRRFGSVGTGDGQFIYPTDVAFGPDGWVFVSEYGGNDRVSIFGADGKFLKSFGRPGSGTGEFTRPSALAVSEQGDTVYVADACNHRVAKYTRDGELIGYLGSDGRGPGEFRYPYGLALEKDGTLVVCEYGNNRIQILSPEGKCRKLLGHAGRAHGQLAYPWGVAAGERGRLYVVDSGNNRIQVWQP